MKINLPFSTTSIRLSNTIITSGGMFVRLACQACTLIVISRILGPHDYGIFIAVLGVNLLFAPLSGLGFDTIALRESAVKPAAAGRLFHQGMKAIFVSAPFWLLISTIISINFLHVQLPTWLLLLLASSDLFVVRIIELAAKIYQGQAKMAEASLLRLLVPSIRLLFAIFFAFLSCLHHLTGWIELYFLSSIAALLTVLWLLKFKKDWYVVSSSNIFSSMKDGLFFATNIVASRFLTDADKPLIMRINSEYYVGIYAVAYKFYELSVIPILALFMSNNGALFSTFIKKEYSNHYVLLTKLALRSLSYSVFICVGIYFFIEPTITLFAGQKYSDVSAIKGVLCLIPFAFSMRQIGEHGLAAQNKLVSRATIQWFTVVFSVSLNLLLLPTFGWIAAAWTCLLSESLLAGLYFIRLRINYKHIQENG